MKHKRLRRMWCRIVGHKWEWEKTIHFKLFGLADMHGPCLRCESK